MLGVAVVVGIDGVLNGCFGKKLKFAALASVDNISSTCLIIDGQACGFIDILNESKINFKNVNKLKIRNNLPMCLNQLFLFVLFLSLIDKL